MDTFKYQIGIYIYIYRKF